MFVFGLLILKLSIVEGTYFKIERQKANISLFKWLKTYLTQWWKYRGVKHLLMFQYAFGRKWIMTKRFKRVTKFSSLQDFRDVQVSP